MSFRPNLNRKRLVFSSPSSAMGFFACLVLAFITSAAIAGFAKSTILPEIALSTVYIACFFTVTAMACGFLFSAEWIVYPALILQGMGILLITFLDVINALSAKIDIISKEIIRYEPDYYIPYHDMGLTVAAALLACLCLMVFAHFLLRCKGLVPILLASAVTMGLFVALERNDSAHFYIMILCILAMLCVAVQGKAGKGMGSVLPVTKIGIKTLAFLLASVFVLLPVASNESFSKSVMDAISQLTGIKPPTASPGGFGDASGEASFDGYEQFMNDLEEKQSTTDLEDIEFQNILLYIVSGANDDADMFLRRRVHYKYSDNTWTLDTSNSADLTDDSYRTMSSFVGDMLFEEDVFDPAYSFTTPVLEVTAVQRPLYIAVAAGAVNISKEQFNKYYDLDNDDTPEQYPAYSMFAYSFPRMDTDDGEWYALLRKITQTLRDAGVEPYINPPEEDTVISGDKMLDKELIALSKKILVKYGGFESYDAWLADDAPVTEAVRAVQKYLSQTKIYTMNPQMSDRYQNYDHEKDSIYNFLFNTGEGYCVQFSSTAVLLLRSLGIQTRYVTGYSSRSADSNGERYIYDSNSHAWCEVFVDGIGWLPFEMTYGAMQNSIGSDGPVLEIPMYVPTEESDVSDETSEPETSEEESSVPEESSEAESSTEESSEGESSDISSESGLLSEDVSGEPKNNKKAIIYCICGALCVIIVTLIAALIYRRNEKRRKRVYKARFEYSCGKGDPNQGIIELHTQHIKLLKLKGFTPIKGEKYPEYIKRVCRSDPNMPNPSFVMEYFRKAEFGGKCTADELKTAGKHILALNDYMLKNIGGFKKKKAYFKGLLTKPYNTLKKE